MGEEGGRCGWGIFSEFGEFAWDDGDEGTDGGLVEESDDIAGAHADTAPADGGAEFRFFGGAVDVNASGFGVAILGVEAIEPDDSGDDGVATGGIDGEDFVGGDAMFDDRAAGEIVADFVADFEIAEGSFVAADGVAEAEF